MSHAAAKTYRSVQKDVKLAKRRCKVINKLMDAIRLIMTPTL